MIRLLWLSRVTAVGAVLSFVYPAGGAQLVFENGIPTVQGESSDVCLGLVEGEDRIAGLQANLVWDDRCVTPTNGARPCRAAPESGKTVQAALQGRGVLKAIVISFEDTNPIPDGRVFCCSFVAVGDPGQRCTVSAYGIIGSTATGRRIDDIRSANTASIGIRGDGAGLPTPSATATVPRQVSDDGCSMRASGKATGTAYLLAILLPAARRWRMRMSS